MKMYYEKRLRLKSQEMAPYVIGLIPAFSLVIYKTNAFSIGIFLGCFSMVLWTFCKTPKDKGFS